MDKNIFEFLCSSRAAVCGILNVTPDSFSDGGLYNSAPRALERALEMESQGAGIIDLGAQSTRPGSVKISADEELSRLAPVLEALRGRVCVTLSVDTFYPQVARYALERGVSVINDVSGSLRQEMVELAKEYGAGLIVMHSGGAPDGDIVAAVAGFFRDTVSRADEAGLDRRSLCLDPGFGFGKDAAENLRLLMNISAVKVEGVALMAALSRKRFIGEFSGESESSGRDSATAFADAVAVLGGADIVRVHDVRRAVNTVRAAFDARGGKHG